MRYLELKTLNENATIGSGFYSPEDDTNRKAVETENRRPRLTLRMINKLKKIRSAKKFEQMQKQKVLSVMYKEPGDDAGAVSGF